MITNISLMSVWVKDIDESLAFYTDVLGFEVGDDLQLGPDFRWCTVFHPKQPEIHIHLTTPSGPLPDYLIEAMNRAQDEGGLPGIGMHVDDCHTTYEELDAFFHLWTVNRGVLLAPFHNMSLFSPFHDRTDVDAHTSAFRGAVEALLG